MVTVDVLAKIRRLMEQVDLSTTMYEDEELLAAVADARDDLELQHLDTNPTSGIGWAFLTVGYDKMNETSYGILPEPFGLILGTVLAYRAAVRLLWTHYRDRVSRGEIGTIWTSGMESESTLFAGRSYESSIESLDAEAWRLLVIYNAPFVSKREQ